MSEELVKAAPAELSELSPTLTLDEIAAATGINKSALVRYISESETRQILYTIGKPARYPRAHMPMFHALAQAHKEGTVKPKTAAAMLRARFGIRNDGIESQDAAVIRTVENPFEFRNPKSEMLQELTAALREHSEELRQYRQSLPSPVPVLPDDALLTLTEAHERYGLALSTLRAISFVEGRRRKVRRSDVLGLIQGMGRKLE